MLVTKNPPRGQTKKRAKTARTNGQAEEASRSPPRSVLVAEIRPPVYRPPGTGKGERRQQKDHPQGRVGVQVGGFEGGVAGGVHHVEDWVEERRHPQEAREHLDRVEHPAQEGQWLDNHVREERDVVYSRRHSADHRPKGGEGEGGEHRYQE